MKVLSIRGDKVYFDFTQEEYDILLRDGLQKWIDKKIGPNKIKVVSPDPQTVIPKSKPLTKKEMKEEDDFCNELLTLSVVAALEEGLKRDKCNCDGNCGDNCKCKK